MNTTSFIDILKQKVEEAGMVLVSEPTIDTGHRIPLCSFQLKGKKPTRLDIGGGVGSIDRLLRRYKGK